MPDAAESAQPGRCCPLSYRHGPQALAVAPELEITSLYIAGGLYGNGQALAALLELVAREPGPARLCFNGDFHWFDVDDAGFAAINAGVLAHDACLGNVEAELLADDDTVGCGCAYPKSVDAGTVERSNAIHAHLKLTARRHPDALARLKELPMLRRYRVGNVPVGVVHGDAEALAGWRFDVEALDDPANRRWIDSAFRDAKVGVFASSHTCLPALRHFPDAGVVINNGAAGMPNFAGRLCGVVTRIAVSPAPTPALYGLRLGPLHIDALPLEYDVSSWQREFLANWPPGSAGHVSYYSRNASGPRYTLVQAAPPTP